MWEFTMNKYKRRIHAILENDVKSLEKLADTKDWYKIVQSKNGNTYLHYAVRNKRRKVFEYLLSLTDIPLNHRNKKGKTVLNLCLEKSYDYLASKLIKKGASLDCMPLEPNEAPLHYAIRNKLVEVSKTLMEMGCDVNEPDKSGATPLWMCLRLDCSLRNTVEMATALLCHGADPKQPNDCYNNIYEYVVCRRIPVLEEIFLDFMVDDSNLVDIHYMVILNLAYRKSPLLSRTIEHTGDIIVPKLFLLCFPYSLQVQLLDDLSKWCPSVVKKFFSCVEFPPHFLFKRHEGNFLTNFNFLLESNLRDYILDLIHRFSNELFTLILNEFSRDETIATEYICFLLSYGLTLNENHLIILYRRYGFGELIKILLHMEIEVNPLRHYIDDAFLLLIYDVHFDLQDILNKILRYKFSGASKLLPYFSHEKLRMICSKDERSEVVSTIANQPTVPLLLELARNVFRNFFVKTFEITSARQFYRLVDQFPIPSGYKDIITFKRKLY